MLFRNHTGAGTVSGTLPSSAAGVTILNVQPVGPNGLRDVETLTNWLG